MGFLYRFFEQPAWLLLLVLALPLVASGWYGLRALSHERRWLAVGLRLLVLLIATLLLSGFQLDRTSDRLTVMAVVDQSASVRQRFVPPEGQSFSPWLTHWIGRVSADRQDDDCLGVIGFAGNAQLISVPRTDCSGLGEVRSNGYTADEGTNVEQAIELALASKSDAGSGLRLLLAWDGRETYGSALRAAQHAAALGVPIDVIPLDFVVKNDVSVESVSVAQQVRDGQKVNLRVALRGTDPVGGSLLVSSGDHLLDLNGDAEGSGLRIGSEVWVNEQGVRSVKSGEGNWTARIDLDLPVVGSGVHPWKVVFEPDAEEMTSQAVANDKAEAFTIASGRGKVLIVSDAPAANISLLEDALLQSGIHSHIVGSGDVPLSLGQLMPYDAIVIQGVSYDRIGKAGDAALRRYVHDIGGGLVMLGGPGGFGAGGWTHSEVDRFILPVDCEIPADMVLPTGAIVFVIDKSGSMACPVAGTKFTQQEIAAEATIESLSTLYAKDLVGVVAFDGSAQWVVDLQENTRPKITEKLIRRIGYGGGTHISAGIQAAWESLSKVQTSDGGMRHIILLTDGCDAAGQLDVWARKLSRDGISLSAIGIGDSQNNTILSALATACNGQYYPVVDPRQLPQIFLKEAQTLRRNLVVEEPFIPVLNPSGLPMMRGIQEVPPLNGYVITHAKPDPRIEVPLTTAEGAPVLAWQQAGLGRCVAFTSDLSSRWSSVWLGWGGFQDFFGRMVRSVARPPVESEANMSCRFDGDQLVVQLETDPGFHADKVVGAAISPSGEAVSVQMRAMAPGLWESRITAPEAGNWIVDLQSTMRAKQSEGQAVTRRALGGATRLPGSEMRDLASRRSMVERLALLTGGRVFDPYVSEAPSLFDRGGRTFIQHTPIPLTAPLLWILLVVCLFDIANRRILWESAPMRRAFRSLLGMGRGAHSSGASVTALDSVRKRSKEHSAPVASSSSPSSPQKRSMPAATEAPAPKPSEPPLKPVPSSAPLSDETKAVDEDSPLGRLRAAKQRARDHH